MNGKHKKYQGRNLNGQFGHGTVKAYRVTILGKVYLLLALLISCVIPLIFSNYSLNGIPIFFYSFLTLFFILFATFIIHNVYKPRCY